MEELELTAEKEALIRREEAATAAGQKRKFVPASSNALPGVGENGTGKAPAVDRGDGRTTRLRDDSELDIDDVEDDSTSGVAQRAIPAAVFGSMSVGGSS
jgi:hypothetical protein